MNIALFRRRCITTNNKDAASTRQPRNPMIFGTNALFQDGVAERYLTCNLRAAQAIRSTRSQKKKALLIGIDYNGSKSQEVLDLPHDDVFKLKQFLIDAYGYSAQDITLLLDKPGEIQPTAKNIRKEAARLVAGAAAGDHFFFYYAGHSTQVPEVTEEHTEIDGKDEVLVPSDGRTTNYTSTRESCLVDNELHRLLVYALPEGSTLMAVLDTCHSASLLDLDHDICNWKLTILAQSLASPMISLHNANTGRISPKPLPKTGPRSALSRKPELTDEAAHNIDSLRMSMGPQHKACARIKSTKKKMPCAMNEYGKIPRSESPLGGAGHGGLVSCISACKKNQVTMEIKGDKNGGSFTERLLNILRDNPHPRLEDLMTKISISIHGMLLDAASIQELHNCQDPQLSSETKIVSCVQSSISLSFVQPSPGHESLPRNLVGVHSPPYILSQVLNRIINYNVSCICNPKFWGEVNPKWNQQRFSPDSVIGPSFKAPSLM
ncbi:caspase domain-containing protein [Mycena latifolia]|nr:caspase domain-containing protein [Mycena latifolia]